MAIDITHADDLRKVYLQVFDGFAINSPGEVTQQYPHINSRYSRELLGALVTGNMLTLTDVNGEDAWQVADPGTYDNHTREEAEAVIDKWLGKAGATPKSTNKKGSKSVSSKKKEASPCLCGCGEMAMSNYRPGHDARHAGQIGREIAAIMNGGHDEDGQIKINTLIEMLPSEHLRAKAHGVAMNVNKKNLAKAKPEPVLVEGTAKVGKNEMVARRHPNGLVEYLTLKGDWKTASASASKTFQEG